MGTGGEAARADLRGGVGWVVFGLLILISAWRMDRFESMGGTLYTAPGLVPGAFGVLLVLLGTMLAWRGRRGRALAEAPGPLFNQRVLGMLALTLIYAAAAIGRLPFAPITALFVTLFCGLYAPAGPPLRRWGVAALCGLLSTAAVVLVFEQLFFVRLP